MKVGELIEALRREDPDMDVLIGPFEGWYYAIHSPDIVVLTNDGRDFETLTEREQKKEKGGASDCVVLEPIT
jgi:hypothetical protein